ncbi:hypothetical protein JNW90_13705 [Micromonospora sp. STR1s_5]|nr:hypothetical protein [Micromonospora sp. STR1s_5]
MSVYVFKDQSKSSAVGTQDLHEMDEEEFRTAVAGLISDAAHYIDEHVAPDRVAATAYYRGDLLGNEEEGRSKIVMTVVRDVIQSMLPSLLRTFDGPKAVQVLPFGQEDAQEAQDKTDAVNFVFKVRNEGFKILFDAIKDALIRKVGVITWGAREEKAVRAYIHKGMTREMIDAFSKKDGVEIVSETPEDEDDTATPDEANPHMPGMNPVLAKAMEPEDDDEGPEGQGGLPAIANPLQTFTIRFNQITKRKRVWVDSVPPEELLINRSARSEADALLIGRRQNLTIGELVSIGYDYDEVAENAGASSWFSVSPTNNEAQTRNPALFNDSQGESNDPTLSRVQYTEVFVRVDKDGDGIPELRRVCTLGDGHYVLHDEVWEDEEPPYALICPDPEPHMAIGYSVADQVADLQEIVTQIVRNTLDSLANSIHPRTAVLEHAVDMDDVLNTEVGAIIRMTQPGAVQELSKQFIGADALGVLGYFDQIRARRTGITDGSQGLNGDELQSTSAIGISAQLSAAQERLELIARLFAETGLKRLFKGLLRTIIRHADGPMPILSSTGDTHMVDPTLWNADADVTVNVGLGKGNSQQRIATLTQVLQLQIQCVTQFGLDQPVVQVSHIRNTVADICREAGIQDVKRHFGEVPANWQPPQNQNQQPDPLTVQAQAALMQTQLGITKAQLDHELDIQKLAQERELKMKEMELKYHAQLNEAQIRAEIDHARNNNQMMLAQQNAAQQQAAQAQQPQAPM